MNVHKHRRHRKGPPLEAFGRPLSRALVRVWRRGGVSEDLGDLVQLGEDTVGIGYRIVGMREKKWDDAMTINILAEAKPSNLIDKRS